MTQPSTARQPGLATTVALYTAARLGLLAAIAALLVLAGVPVLVAVLVGLIVALPLSMVLFRGLRGRLDAALSATRDRRATERDALRARLRGDSGAESPLEVKTDRSAPADPPAGVADDTSSDPAAPGQPDRGQH